MARAMRRRFVQDPETLELIEVSEDYISGPRSNTDAVLWNDRAYQDVGDQRFTSRKQHREYMKRNGLTTVDDFTGEFRAAERRRVEVLQGVDRSRKNQIAEAIHKLRG